MNTMSNEMQDVTRYMRYIRNLSTDVAGASPFVEGMDRAVRAMASAGSDAELMEHYGALESQLDEMRKYMSDSKTDDEEMQKAMKGMTKAMSKVKGNAPSHDYSRQSGTYSHLPTPADEHVNHAGNFIYEEDEDDDDDDDDSDDDEGKDESFYFDGDPLFEEDDDDDDDDDDSDDDEDEDEDDDGGKEEDLDIDLDELTVEDYLALKEENEVLREHNEQLRGAVRTSTAAYVLAQNCFGLTQEAAQQFIERANEQPLEDFDRLRDYEEMVEGVRSDFIAEGERPDPLSLLAETQDLSLTSGALFERNKRLMGHFG